MNTKDSFPYEEIVGKLVASTMRAQAVLVAANVTKKELSGIHGQINKHFSWLALTSARGKNRHFFDAPHPLEPLRVEGLVNEKSIDPQVRIRLDEGRSPDDNSDGVDIPLAVAQKYWQHGPTRISSLIVTAFEEDIRSQWDNDKESISIRSPLALVYDLLTAPDTPGTRAFALVALRNFLFGELRIVPSLGDFRSGEFSVDDVETQFSYIWTSLRARHHSKGKDKLAVGNGEVALVRHFLGMKGVLRFYFGGKKKSGVEKKSRKENAKECIGYLESGRLINPQKDDTDVDSASYPFEVEKSPRLEKLPDVAELVNELWGLPLPIRGADTVFRGGLKFSGRGGLVMAIHGGPGCGKTSLALAFGAHLAPFGIRTLFITGEEDPDDLKVRINSLVPESIARLDFFPEKKDIDSWFECVVFPRNTNEAASSLDLMDTALDELKSRLNDHIQDIGNGGFGIPKPCRAIVVIDGLHDLFAESAKQSDRDLDTKEQLSRLYRLIDGARELRALVILTTGTDWSGDSRLDYLVDVAIRLSHESIDQYGAKPDRRLHLSKTRHQLSAAGTHGFQIAGTKGVRFSPQINYQLDRRATWKVRVPNEKTFKKVVVTVAADYKELTKLPDSRNRSTAAKRASVRFVESCHGPKVFVGSHVFLNGQGSGGKAALALKIAMAPSFDEGAPHKIIEKPERILVVSFLYPKEYYEELLRRLRLVRATEYGLKRNSEDERRLATRMEVIHLYPGHLRPNDLYNRIEWELDGGELNGDPYTCVVIDGIHNVFLQFPEIESYKLFWPQIYNSLRSRPIMTITTHTTLSVPRAIDDGTVIAPLQQVDDNRSEPLRHALVQKTDFQFEVDPVPRGKAPYKDNEALSSLFAVRTLSAIGQAIPEGWVLWSREKLVFVEPPISNEHGEGHPKNASSRA